MDPLFKSYLGRKRKAKLRKIKFALKEKAKDFGLAFGLAAIFTAAGIFDYKERYDAAYRYFKSKPVLEYKTKEGDSVTDILLREQTYLARKADWDAAEDYLLELNRDRKIAEYLQKGDSLPPGYEMLIFDANENGIGGE